MTNNSDLSSSTIDIEFKVYSLLLKNKQNTSWFYVFERKNNLCKICEELDVFMIEKQCITIDVVILVP